MITGVAKAILTHFKKKPLAIVNVKGRANGTSVRELIFKLEVRISDLLFIVYVMSKAYDIILS